MTKVCLSILENAWSIKMNDDDIAYITIHIGGELVHSETKPTPPAVLTLVCDEGIGVQNSLCSSASNIYLIARSKLS